MSYILINMSTRLLVHKLAYFLDELLLSALGIAVVLRHDIAVAVAYDYVRDGLNAECALEVAIRVEEHLVLIRGCQRVGFTLLIF